MIHYSCDRCKRPIDPHEEIRYVVNIEVQAAMDDVALGEDEADRDYLMEAHEALERAEDLVNGMVDEDIYAQRRFDLCATCYRKFVKNPVGSDLGIELNYFSNN